MVVIHKLLLLQFKIKSALSCTMEEIGLFCLGPFKKKVSILIFLFNVNNRISPAKKSKEIFVDLRLLRNNGVANGFK